MRSTTFKLVVPEKFLTTKEGFASWLLSALTEGVPFEETLFPMDQVEVIFKEISIAMERFTAEGLMQRHNAKHPDKELSFQIAEIIRKSATFDFVANVTPSGSWENEIVAVFKNTSEDEFPLEHIRITKFYTGIFFNEIHNKYFGYINFEPQIYQEEVVNTEPLFKATVSSKEDSFFSKDAILNAIKSKMEKEMFDTDGFVINFIKESLESASILGNSFELFKDVRIKVISIPTKGGFFYTGALGFQCGFRKFMIPVPFKKYGV